MGSDGWEGTLAFGKRRASLAEVRSLYHRRPSGYAASDDSQTARFAAAENRRGLGGVLGSLPNCLYLSHPLAIARAEYKPFQLAVAAREGFRVPATLITNCPSEARSFIRRQRSIYKPLHAGAYQVDGEAAGVWAAEVLPEEIDDSVRNSAHLFQELVQKTHDVRAIAIGSRIFAARIQASEGVLDWRSDYRNLSYSAIACPDDVASGIHRFLAEFGLSFGAFDFAVTADGTWWFLECNPNGQWAWLEYSAGLPLTQAIADVLENGKVGE